LLILDISLHEFNQKSIALSIFRDIIIQNFLLDHGLMVRALNNGLFRPVLDKVYGKIEHAEIHHKPLIFLVLIGCAGHEHAKLFIIILAVLVLRLEVFFDIVLTFELAQQVLKLFRLLSHHARAASFGHVSISRGLSGWNDEETRQESKDLSD
jgi:hypothetical protein